MKSLEECRRFLGLDPHSGLGDRYSKEELKAAFRLRAKAVHPDLQGGSTEAQAQFTLLRSAYETLLALNLEGPAPPPPPPRTVPTPRAPARLDFVTQLNSLLWDIEDLFRAVRRSRCQVYRTADAHRDLLEVLVLIDARILVPAGLGDHFQSARGRPEAPPSVAVASLLGATRTGDHAPYTSVENYFFSLRLRSNRFEAAARHPAPALLGSWIEAYQEAVHAVVRITEALDRDQPPRQDYPTVKALVLADRGFLA